MLSDVAADPASARAAPSRHRPDLAQLRQLEARCRDLCYSAVRTIAALPDRERRWLYRLPSGSPDPVFSAADAAREWGLDIAVLQEAELMEERRRKAARYRPTPEEIDRCLDVLGWLTWLQRERHGKAERQIIAARAYGVSYRSLAERFGRSDETIRRWESAAFRTIALHFRSELEALS